MRLPVTCFTAMDGGQIGSIGFPARCVETRLRQYGYWLQGPNDRFDTTAVTTLKVFQNREGLPTTGVADYTTLVRLGVCKHPGQPVPGGHVQGPLRGATRDDRGVRRPGAWRPACGQLGYLGWVGPNLTFDSTAAGRALRNFQYKMGLKSQRRGGRPRHPPAPRHLRSGRGRRPTRRCPPTRARGGGWCTRGPSSASGPSTRRQRRGSRTGSRVACTSRTPARTTCTPGRSSRTR